MDWGAKQARLIDMRTVYKIFAIMLVFVLVTSFLFNYNKMNDYFILPKRINEMIFGMSYIIPMNVFGFIMLYQTKFFWERVVCRFFLWFSISALIDELFFDPFKPEMKEHVFGLIILIIIYYYERSKKIRD